MTIVKVQKCSEQANLPVRATTGSAGYDVYAIHETWILPNEVKLIPLGFSMEIPPGFEAQIRPRSGLAMKHSISVLNSPGTIDSDYRGEVGVLLMNFGKQPYKVECGERIAQMVFCKLPEVELCLVNELSDSSERGTGGFGSTGKTSTK